MRKVNSNMDRAKYQCVNIYGIEMACECVVVPQKGYIFMWHDLAPCHNSISIENSYHCKGILILE